MRSIYNLLGITPVAVMYLFMILHLRTLDIGLGLLTILNKLQPSTRHGLMSETSNT